MNWQTRKTEQVHTVLPLCFEDYTFKSWRRSEKCPMYVLKLSSIACTWLELVDLTFFCPCTSLLAQLPNGHELATDVQLA